MKMSGEMFEGEDYPTQWALNPSTYQKMNSDQVDWAALAQQWIKMKETSIPPAPPPPSIVESNTNNVLNDGGGEAPMDMDTKDDDIPPAPPAPTISGTEGWNQWNQWGGHWNQAAVGATGNWEWSNLSGGPDVKSIGMTNVPNNTIIPPPAPTISANSSSFTNHCAASVAIPPVSPSLPSSYGYSTMPLSHTQYNNQVSSGNFWNNEQQQSNISVQPPFMKSMRQNTNRLVSTSIGSLSSTDIITSRNRDVRERSPEEDSSSMLDNIKRRQLPAWIREGLEKMEREKQKAVERERQEILRKEELEARKKIEDQARAVLNPCRSKFDSDSEKEATEHEYDEDIKCDSNSNDGKRKDNEHSPDLMKPRKTRFHDAASPTVHSNVTTSIDREKNFDTTTTFSNSLLQPSKEEILQNLMLKVRRSLTEILLEVTNDEIGSVCREVWKRSCSKASTGKSFIQTSHNAAPLAQITRKLGLGIYGDSNSDSEEEHVLQNECSQPSPCENDSDEELKETLRRRQQAFRKTEAEIEARLAQEEEEEQEGEENNERMKIKLKEEQREFKKEDIWKKDEELGDQIAKEKKRNRVEGITKDVEISLKRENYTGNTSCSDAVDNEKDMVYSNQRKSSEIRSNISRNVSISGKTTSTSKSTAGDIDKQSSYLSRGDDSSSSENSRHCISSKRTAHCNYSKNKNSKNASSHKKSTRYSENVKDSSSRSRSRSRNKYSSRENSYESSHSSVKTDTASVIANNVAGSGFENRKRVNSNNQSLSKKNKNRSRKSSEKQYYKSRSRSSSQSEYHFYSESRSRSHSRSTSRSRSKYKRSRSRSRSISHRRRHSRDHRRSRSQTRTRTRSRSRSRSGSRSRSRSRKRSRSSYSYKNAATGTGIIFGIGKKRDSRSRSIERGKRSKSNTRTTKNYYQHRSNYRRDGKKSTHRYQD